MTALEVIDRRLVLRGLIAAPTLVAVTSLMPIRGIVMPIPDFIDVEPANLIGGTLVSNEQRLLYERLRAKLMADGIWDKLDHLWLFGAAQTEEEANIDLRSIMP